MDCNAAEPLCELLPSKGCPDEGVFTSREDPWPGLLKKEGMENCFGL